MNAEPVVDYLLQRHDAVLGKLNAFLRLPSVSTDPAYAEGMAAARSFLLDWLTGIGLSDVQLLDGGGHPAVYGAWLGAPGAPTIIVYGHYDVQPPDPLALWRTPPFEPTIQGGNLHARGASDVKGSTTIAIESVAGFLAVHGGCPVNIKLFLEGEEETGSPSLHEIVRRHGPLLEADAMISADGGRQSAIVPTINVGARGLTKLELIVRSAEKELHSGRYGGGVRNALHELAAIIPSLHDENGAIAIPALMAALPLPSPHDRRDAAALPFDEAAFVADVGGIAAGEPGYSLRERLTLRPAIDVNGMWGGYTGAGSKTVIPDEARAKITIRLAPGQDPKQALQALQDHIRSFARPGVRITFAGVGAGAPASTLAGNHPLVQAATRVLRRVWQRDPIHVRLGATVPITAIFKELLDIDTLMFGLNLPDEDVHAPNEFFHIDSIVLGLRSWPLLLQELATFAPAEFRVRLGISWARANPEAIPIPRNHKPL
ncbi:M20 family dipeptidase [Bosea sp. F3-2]|uniref:M20/M25/M40 family metallo-hydrolase n=1 Tax=Bosea sp. F3-2 TaxID=2599640 RepID=UPI0011EEF65B|nr:M20/M25/M40 family metallo-hydrolase [Bosea sp. F3-2]QEL23706.1 M20 family dipeptidase [Bosea sp. F3-2]